MIGRLATDNRLINTTRFLGNPCPDTAWILEVVAGYTATNRTAGHQFGRFYGRIIRSFLCHG